MTEKFVRAQLGILKPIIAGSSLESARKYQDLVGELMALSNKSSVSYNERSFENFTAEWVLPEADQFYRRARKERADQSP